jgi:hypothetical protein
MGWQPLGFFSKKLEQTQQHYSAYNRELLACMLGILHFWFMLEGRPFTLYTDHKSLTHALAKALEPWTTKQSRHLSYMKRNIAKWVQQVAGGHSLDLHGHQHLHGGPHQQLGPTEHQDCPQDRQQHVRGGGGVRSRPNPAGPAFIAERDIPGSGRPAASRGSHNNEGATTPTPNGGPGTPGSRRDGVHEKRETAGPLAPPYSSPYRVISKRPKYFNINIGGQQQAVTVDRLKPHTGTAASTPAAPPRRGRPLATPPSLARRTPSPVLQCQQAPGQHGNGDRKQD